PARLPASGNRSLLIGCVLSVFRDEHPLFAVEMKGAFVPAGDGLAAAVECAIYTRLASAGSEQLDVSAIPQGESMRRNKAQAARIDVTGVKNPRLRIVAVRE